MDHRKMVGLETPGDQRIPVTVRDWDAMKRAIWRGAQGWEIVARQAITILEQCAHIEGCPGETSETETCLQDRYENQVRVQSGCPDRELRMSALVILNAARQFAPTVAPKPADSQYFAPSREYFSEVLSSLAASEVEIARLREELREATASDASTASTEPPPPPLPQPHKEIK